VKTTDHIHHKRLGAVLLDAIADAHDLQIVRQGGGKCTLYDTPGDRTIDVAEVGTWPRTLTPLTVREEYDDVLADLRLLGWSG